MSAKPLELTLELSPRTRYDAIDVRRRITDEFGDVLSGYRRSLYCSLHTTAGFLDQGLCARMQHRRERLDPIFRAFQRLFPPDAGYRHDQLDLRRELSADQRLVEPKNADSHLTFIGSGLRNCVSYVNHPNEPVYFMDLDGVNGSTARLRRAAVLAYDNERTVDTLRFAVPVSTHAIDSVNLLDSRIGLMARIEELLERNDVEQGRVLLTLDPDERDAAVTVNEYETLLMQNDLVDVLRDPFRFVAQRGRNMLRDPLAIPVKSLGYAKYDVVQLLKEMIDAFGMSDTSLERLLSRVMAYPASRLLRLRRTASLPVTLNGGPRPTLIRGTYQSPILIQWRKPGSAGARQVTVTLTRLS